MNERETVCDKAMYTMPVGVKDSVAQLISLAELSILSIVGRLKPSPVTVADVLQIVEYNKTGLAIGDHLS
jgi:hypothetical protein